MSPAKRLFAGVVGLAAGPVIVNGFLPGVMGSVLMVLTFLFVSAMLGSLILFLGFDVTKWRDSGYVAGSVLGIITFVLVTAVLGQRIWGHINFDGIVTNAMNGKPSPGLGAFLGPAAWNAGVFLIGMFVVSLPILAIGTLFAGRGPQSANPPRSASGGPLAP